LAGRRERPDVGAALNALHDKPCHCWTLEELARTAGTSRSVLAERFQQLVGISPMQYLTQWRMLLAANLLRSSNSSLLRIAEEVGYQTDTAFSRAFRREFGRRQRRGGAVRKTGRLIDLFYAAGATAFASSSNCWIIFSWVS
jgi:AraC-like DNA-binding protein